jgi:hypothetical protein
VVSQGGETYVPMEQVFNGEQFHYQGSHLFPFCLDVPVLRVLKSCVAMSRKIRSRATYVSDLSKPEPTKIGRLEFGCEHWNIRTFGDIYRSGAAFDEPLTGRSGNGRKRRVEAGPRLRRARNGYVQTNQ